MKPSDAPRLLAVVGGHSFDRPGLSDLLEAATPGGWSLVEREAVPAEVPYGVSVELRYDISGLALTRGAEPAANKPTPTELAHLRAIAREGIGLVVLHHAIASWPTWDPWAVGIGARFFYAPGRLEGTSWPASGYAMTHFEVGIVDPTHPVCAGLDTFTIDDERYLCPVLQDRVVPLLAAAAPLAAAEAIDTHAEVATGERRPAERHPEGSELLGWVTSVGASPVAVILPGHGPSTFSDPNYRRLLANAVAWAGSAEARTWASARARSTW